MPNVPIQLARSKTKWIVTVLLLALVLIGAILASRSPSRSFARTLPAKQFAQQYQEAKKAALSEGISRDDPASIAGLYIMADPDIPHSHTDSIFITNLNQYFEESDNCISGGPWSFGRVRLVNDHLLVFQTKLHRETPELKTLPSKEWKRNLIRWGARNYIVSDFRLPEFRRAVQTGEEPRDDVRGRFLLRDGDWNKPVSGDPNFPVTSE